MQTLVLRQNHQRSFESENLKGIRAKVKIMIHYHQFAQLLAIDWIMETRTSLWEHEYGNYENDYYNFVPVESSILTKFQNDLNLLRCLTNNIPVSDRDFNLARISTKFFVPECSVADLSLRGCPSPHVWCSSYQNSVLA